MRRQRPGTVRVRRLGPGRRAASHSPITWRPRASWRSRQLLYGHAPPAWTVSVGLASTGLGDPLSGPVQAALPAVIDAVARLLEDAPDA